MPLRILFYGAIFCMKALKIIKNKTFCFESNQLALVLV